MKFLTAELKKILTKRFWGILTAVLLVNLLLYWHNQTNNMHIFDTQVRIQLHQDLMQMDAAERLPYIESHYRLLNACYAWDNYERFEQMGISGTITDDMLKYQDVYLKGNYLHYTNNIYSEEALFSSVRKDLLRIENHHQSLEAVIEEAKLKTSVSIFAKPNTFAFRNQLATIKRFEDLLYIQPVYDVSDGVLNAHNSTVTDLLALTLVMFVCVEMIVTEQKNGMLPILRATQKGRLPLIASKAASAFILTFLITALLWGTNLVYSASVYGLGDLSRPVQSLSGFSSSSLEMSVGTYMLMFFILKWLLYAAVGLLCLIAGLVLQNATTTLLILGGFLSLEYFLAKIINPISAWNILKYVNISNMILTSDWLSDYRNLNLFGQPLEVFTASCILLVMLLFGCFFCLCWLFCSRKTRVLVVKATLHARWPKWLPQPGNSTILFGHELWKLLIECGTLVVLILFVLINLQEPRTVTYNTDDLYYKNYMEILAGPMSEDKEAFLESEANRFADIRSQVAQLNKDYAEGKISSADLDMLKRPLNRALNAEKVLKEKIYPLIENIHDKDAQGKKLWLVYEPGYEYLFGLDTYHDKAGAAAMVLAGIILSFANFYPLETTSGMQPLLNVYARGRNHTAWSKIIISLLLTTALFLVAQIPDYWYIIKNFSFPVLNAPLCSLQAFANWSDSFSILGGILIFEGLRLITVLCLSMIIMLVCQWTRNQLSALCISAIGLLLPLLLHLLDLYFLDSFSFYQSLIGIHLLTGKNPLPLSLLYYGIVLLLGILSVWQILRSANPGNRHHKLRAKIE